MTTTDDREIERVMANMPYGVYVVGSVGPEGPNAMIGDWITQVSFRPRLVSIALENDAHTLANIRATSFFTLNFVREGRDGMDLARRFAAPYMGSKVGGPNVSGVRHKLSDGGYRVVGNGAPVLDAAVAWLLCEAQEFVQAGDHTLVIGRVVDGRMESEEPPLTSAYTGWTYSG